MNKITLILLLLFTQLAHASDPPPPGKMVDVGGYRLHLNCTGNGSPTVVLVSGLGDYSFDWSLVQQPLSAKTRVCSYDRAGYAWSDFDPKPRSLQRAVDELHTLLRSAKVSTPYVLVGHSWGGLIVRVFASQHRDLVAGMLLIDSSHEDQLNVIDGKAVRPRMLTKEQLNAMFDAEDAAMQTAPAPANPKPARREIHPPFDRLTPQAQKLQLWAWSKKRAGDVSDFQEPLILVHETRRDRPHPYGDLPLIVISKGINDDEADGELSAGQIYQDHMRLQADLVQLSTNSMQIIAEKSGHRIQLEQPQLVIDAIVRVLEASRLHKKLS
jgi:pimeloyl-ACP methyl ester carboxylesterase